MNLRACNKFTIGIEDTPQFHYQAAIYVESLAKHLPPGDEIYVVVCNDSRPLSPVLKNFFDVYQDKVKYFPGRQLSRIPCDAHSGEFYPPMNKAEALNVIGDHCQPTDMIVLTDADLFLYKNFDLDCIPRRNTLSSNWICSSQPYLNYDDSGVGIDLGVLLRAMGCQTDLKRGGVSVFLEGSTVRNKKFRADCIRFCQLIHVAGRIIETDKVWLSEMICYALSLALNQIECEVRDIEHFTVENVFDESIKEGSFFHYFISDGHKTLRPKGAFHGSPWQKRDYNFFNLLDDNLEYFAAYSVTEHEKYFFETAIAARNKLARAVR